MSQEKPNEELSPKQKFDLTMKQVNKDNAEARGEEDPDESEEDLRAFEEEDESEEDDESEASDDGEAEVRSIDKNLGQEKLPVTEMTVGEHQKSQVAAAQKRAVTSLMELKSSAKTNLKPEEIRIVQMIVAGVAAGKVKDPVLVHLVNQKAKKVEDFKKAQEEIGKLQQRLLNDISTATNEVVKCKGVIESLDAQILEVAANTKAE